MFVELYLREKQKKINIRRVVVKERLGGEHFTRWWAVLWLWW